MPHKFYPEGTTFEVQPTSADANDGTDGSLTTETAKEDANVWVPFSVDTEGLAGFEEAPPERTETTTDDTAVIASGDADY